MSDAPDKSPDQPVYLVTGSDRPKVDTALERLRRHFQPESIDSVSALEISGDEVAGLCNAGSLFGDARLVVVTDVDGVKAERGRRGGWKAADVDAVAAYLVAPAPSTVLALVAEELRPTAALWKACAKAGKVLAYDVKKSELTSWVAGQFEKRGVRPEPDAVAALIALVGEDLRALGVEIDKIATWAGDEPVGEREVTALVASNLDVPGYQLTEAWATREVARALELSETIFEHDPKPRRDVAPRLAGTLGAHLGRLRTMKRLAAEGVSSKEAAERLQLKPFYASKLYRQAESFSEEELDEAVVRLAELDGALKGQSRLAPDLELQRTLVALARRPGGRA
jgi:DNA polymerase-3 subunit delta